MRTATAGGDPLADRTGLPLLLPPHTCQPGSFASCAEQRALIGRDENGQRICGRCAGADRDYTCRLCGGGEERYRDGFCVRCVARQRLQSLLRNADGVIPEAAAGLIDALVQRRPRSVLRWLGNPASGAHLLGDLVANNDPITHSTLDDRPSSQGVADLRHALVHLGFLPARNEHLARLPVWVARLLAQRDAAHRTLLHRYAAWRILRRARHRAERGRFTATSAQRARAKVRAAAALLRWLGERDLTLQSASQMDIDIWLAEGGSARRLVDDFLRWARRQRYVRHELVVPRQGSRELIETLDEDARWALLSRCLSDDSVPVDVRVAGALLLLYGLPVTQIVALNTDQLVTRDGEFHLTITRHSLALPPALAGSCTCCSLSGRAQHLSMTAHRPSVGCFRVEHRGSRVTPRACGVGLDSTVSGSGRPATQH